jgi:hypothetical protein
MNNNLFFCIVLIIGALCVLGEKPYTLQEWAADTFVMSLRETIGNFTEQAMQGNTTAAEGACFLLQKYAGVLASAPM